MPTSDDEGRGPRLVPLPVAAAERDRPRRRVHYIRSAKHVPGIPPEVAATLDEVARRYVFRANDYYLGLIDWSDPDDPIRKLVIPRGEELVDDGVLDASNEAAVTVVQGVQHKYRDTALVLVNNVCGAYCRYCFRKRLFMDDNDERIHDLEPAYAYIGGHEEITDVLLTGGDPLIASTGRLRGILRRLAAIPHIRTIRIGSKMPAFNPFRILDDEDLHELLRETITPERAVYLMAHFDHPRELTPEAREGIACLQESGVRVVNQCPLIRGINDDVDTLTEMFTEMSLLGAPQYYLFQCRPTAGNAPYEVPIVEGFRIFSEAQRRCSGLSRRARFCMSHATGKVEIVAVDESFLYARYHRAKDAESESRPMIFHRDDAALWLDDLKPVDLSPLASR